MGVDMSTSFGTPPAAGRRALRITDVRHKIGLSHATIYGMVKAGRFPPPFRLGPNSSAWWEHEVDAWLEARAAESRAEAAEAAEAA
jgi:prophage regulatory protein